MIIQERLDILGLDDLFQIGRQVITDFGKRIDLLAIDERGDLYVIELKRDRTPREVVAQALEYGFWTQGLSLEAVRELYAKHHQGDDFDSAFTSHFEGDLPESINTDHHLVVVAGGIDTSSEQIVEYLRGYRVPINVLFFEYLQDGDREYLARSWLSDPEIEASSGASGKKQAPWSGLDFFVAVGENQHRNWDDMRRFGFVSAGHGEKYRKAMSNLFEGARVWAAIPGTGYVGMGEVIAPAVAINDFEVEVDGVTVPILRAPLEASNMGEEADDPEQSSIWHGCAGSTSGRASRRCGRRACSPTRTSSPSCDSRLRSSGWLKSSRLPPTGVPLRRSFKMEGCGVGVLNLWGVSPRIGGGGGALKVRDHS